MHDELTLITTLAVALGLALIAGFVATRLRLPAIVGYLLAGVAIGPATPGFVADVQIASQLAEIGVMLLMFGVGLHFALEDLLAVRRIAVPGAVVQMVAATAMGAALAHWWGWDIGAGLVFGLALSVASTVVLLRALEHRGVLESFNGQIAVGWLVVEDLAMVLVLVLLPPLAEVFRGEGIGGGQLATTLGFTLLRVGAFVVLMLVIGRRLFPWILWQVTRTGSRELFTLCVIAAAVSIAFVSAELFGVSFALGAFFAGMVLRESEFSHRAAEESLPLRDAFAVLFFVSVGMLFDPRILIDKPLEVIAVVAIILVGKSLAAAAIVLLLRYSLSTALTVSASLAQIGEFSFILAGLGVSLGMLSLEGQSLILAGALISIAVNPLLFTINEPLQRALRKYSEKARSFEQPHDPLAALPSTTEPQYLSRQVVLVGYGGVGRQIATALAAQSVPVVVIERDREKVEDLRERQVAAVFGDATEAMVLVQAHIARARALVVASPEPVGIAQMVAIARELNPSIDILVRSHNEEEAQRLEKELGARVFLGETELARAMVAAVCTESAGQPAHPNG